jgi:glucokinase
MSMYSIGVDLGGTNLRIGAFLQDGECLGSRSVRTDVVGGPTVAIRDIVNAVNELKSGCGSGRELIGIGIGTPGPLELPIGILRNPPNLVGWSGFPLLEELRKALGPKVYLENDANLAALAEWAFGAGQTYAPGGSLAMLTLGTGVGSGIILDGKIWHGFCGMGGEAGHVVVFENGAPCGCGGKGCLEQYASATAISRLGKEHGLKSSSGDLLTSAEIAALAREGNAAALEVFRIVGQGLGLSLAGLINTLNLPLYVVGGGVAQSWDLFAPAMFEEARFRSYVYRLTLPRNERTSADGADGQTIIVPAQRGSESGLLGAAMLPFNLQENLDKEASGAYSTAY